MSYAAFYTSLIYKHLSEKQMKGECIKSAPFIHMLARKNIVFIEIAFSFSFLL